MFYILVDPQYLEREGLYIGQGITTMSRAGIFRDLSGLGVDMTDRVFRLTSFNGKFFFFFFFIYKKV